MARKRKIRPGAPPLDDGVAGLRALAHPLRLRVMELFAEAPRTTKQVADLLGQPPTRLYHHVAALERAGLLRLKETRKNRGTTEKWYEAISRTLGTAPRDVARRAGGADRKAVALTVVEQSRQEIIQAIQQPTAELPMVARLVIAAPTAKMPEVRDRLYAFMKQIQTEYSCDDPAPTDAADADRWAMTLTFAPVWPRRR